MATFCSGDRTKEIQAVVQVNAMLKGGKRVGYKMYKRLLEQVSVSGTLHVARVESLVESREGSGTYSRGLFHPFSTHTNTRVYRVCNHS